ncbi:MAG: hypothetical protein Kow00124_07240 [Anaerolineae bacterium]
MISADSATSIRRPGAILALICLPVFIGALDLTVVSAVLPDVIADLRIPFQTGADEASWVVSGYLLAYTVSVAFMGRISDLIGRRRTYFIALLIFILGSWLVATADYAPARWMRTLFRLIEGGRPDPAYMALYALIAGRVVQALGAGAMVPTSMALVADLFPAGRRAVPLGVIGAVDTGGWVLGHLYGGLMVQVVDWPVLFWINIPITAVVAYITWQQLRPVAAAHGEGGMARPALILIGIGLAIVTAQAVVEMIHGLRATAFTALAGRLLALNWLMGLTALALLAALVVLIATTRLLTSASRPDWAGIGLLSLALFALTAGLGGGEVTGHETLGEGVTLTGTAAIWLAAASVSLAGFLIVERRSRHPLFGLHHFKERNVAVSSAVNLGVGFCLMLGLVSVPLFVNTVIAASVDEGALLSGILLGTLTIPMALASVPGGLLTRLAGYRITTALGMLIAAGGFFLGRTWTPDVSQITMGLHMALAGIGLGLTVAPISTAVINAVPNDERGIASGLVIVMRLIGMTFGTALMTNYGLTRSNVLTERYVAELGQGADLTALLQVGVRVATDVINEMLIIAAVICLAVMALALLLRPRDRPDVDAT